MLIKTQNQLSALTTEPSSLGILSAGVSGFGQTSTSAATCFGQQATDFGGTALVVGTGPMGCTNLTAETKHNYSFGERPT